MPLLAELTACGLPGYKDCAPTELFFGWCPLQLISWYQLRRSEIFIAGDAKESEQLR